MGLLREGINEVIATTKLNAAPIGIIKRNDATPKMVLFHGTHTKKNILDSGVVVANLIYDPVCYVKTAFEDISKDHFVEKKVNDFTVWHLREAEAWAAYETKVLHDTEESIVVELTLIKEEILKSETHPVNRGFNNIIDATVHATRYVLNRDPNLKSLIDYHLSVARKCGGKRELKAVELLNSYIDSE
ncbi:DUF447 family protein [Methanoplanus sp. FWC-SCC4]|uniref:DUF447 family protein n=1 Tax=Methanochimaera problematica TaxID=2609417 RepID=A0AA97FC28_9EURY|nr:DUF447 domain-containing protein [Methanoplanus sp. FWC-SCC4]WOF16312.1 DUF447 family protein [Methanoplanus sp. FWC-SCC4]